MQDPNPMPWGALDRFQAHFIVKKDAGVNVRDYLAKTVLSTRGHFSSKQILKVTWNGPGILADKLNSDKTLNELILKQTIKDAKIYIEPTDGAIRIRGSWNNHLAFGITKELYQIYDMIASHIKSI